jgi:hypothetical protein
VSDPAAAFHTAQDGALRGSNDLGLLWPDGRARIYSTVPQNAPLPFIRIGDDQVLEDSTDCASGSEVFASVHVWTRPDPPSLLLGREIAGVIRDVLTDEGFTVPGWDMVLALFVDTRHLTDPEGSSHAVLTFHYALTDLADA